MTQNRTRAAHAAVTLGPAAAFALVQLAVPALRHGIFASFERDFDEGGNVMKALLVARGARLYDDVWSDQPPLFTHALALVFRAAGCHVAAARLLVLATALALLVCGARFVAREAGPRAAVWSSLLLVSSPWFLGLSTSVLIGLPALALAVAALDVATAPRRSARADVVAGACAGLLLAAACLVKLFVAPLGVVLVAFLVAQRRRRAAVALIAAACVVGGGSALAVGEAGRRLLVLPHVATGGAALGLGALEALAPVLPLAVLAAFALRRRGPLAACAAWALVDAVLVAGHTPRWWHHELLVTVPAALCAGAALDGAWRAWRRGLHAGPLAVAALAAWAVTALPAMHVAREAQPADDVVAALKGARLVLTDRPMVAFRAGAEVPPTLAVVSAKRAAFDDVDGIFVFFLDAAKPDAVYLGRLPLPRLERALADGGWRRVDGVGPGALYRR